ncbi:hypothetical protein ACI8AC_23725 [Geodermatophilus sp. SYSU D00758]
MNTGGLGPAGRRLVREILAQLREDGLEPDAREEELLRQAAALADRLTEVREALAKQGLTTTTAAGGLRPHPLLGVERECAMAIKRLLDGVSFSPTPVKNAAKQRAAQVRWRAHNEARAARESG